MASDFVSKNKRMAGVAKYWKSFAKNSAEEARDVSDIDGWLEVCVYILFFFRYIFRFSEGMGYILICRLGFGYC